MSLLADAMATLRRVILLDDKVGAIDAKLTDLSRLHADTRERVMRIEGFIDAARLSRLSRPTD